MNLSPEEFVERLLSKDAEEQPTDDVKNAEDIVMELPEWFDEKKFNQGLRFYKDNSYGIFMSLILGAIALLSIPSIVRILVSTRKSNSCFTAYKRYSATFYNYFSWLDHDLKPGTLSWKSLYWIRKLHVNASKIAKSKGIGIISQRDVALVQFISFGYGMLKPNFFGIKQLRDGDWEAYNHFWRVIGYMLGLKDRYNVCKDSVEETREICQILLDRVYTPYLNKPTEYFEHMSRSFIDGMWTLYPMLDEDAYIFWSKNLANIPGYIYTEEERINLRKKLKEQLKGKSVDTGVESSLLIEKPAVKDIIQEPRLLYYQDYETINLSPEYRKLSVMSKLKLIHLKVSLALCSFTLGRYFYNYYFKVLLFLFPYFPLLSFFRFGIKKSFTDMFESTPTDNTKPKLNAEYQL